MPSEEGLFGKFGLLSRSETEFPVMPMYTSRSKPVVWANAPRPIKMANQNAKNSQRQRGKRNMAGNLAHSKPLGGSGYQPDPSSNLLDFSVEGRLPSKSAKLA